jgi:Uma2 family endonuclease
MATSRAVLTAEEFLAMPEDNSRLHQRIVVNLAALLHAHIREHRAAILTARGIEGSPTLHIEVLSPSTRHLDRGRRRELYARHGVPYGWMVETDERVIEAYELAGGAYRPALRATGEAPVSLPPFPALSLAPEALWRP